VYRRVPKLRYTFSVRPVHRWWTGLLTPVLALPERGVS